MTKRTALILGLSVALVGTNVFWLSVAAKWYTHVGIASGHFEWERRATADAARSAVALIPVVASGKVTRTDLLEALRKVDPSWIPQDRGNVTYVGGLALEFGPDSKLSNVYQMHSICC